MGKLRVDFKDKFQCSGCSACANKCPKQCISMHPDGMGFLYPRVDDSACVNCGLCIKICPFGEDKTVAIDYNPPKVFASRVRDEKQLMNSQSGGMFYAFSEYVINNGGVVYGAGLNENFKVEHKRVTTKEEREELRLSKYSQSDIHGVYSLVRLDILSGRLVLFTGTPCQVSGIKSFIGELSKMQNFIAVDLVCHGVPSPKIWDDFLKYIGGKYNAQITKAVFRDKQYGWASHVETFKLDTGKYIASTTFRGLFYDHYSVRLSCSKCPFTNMKRVGDITIGDYWGWNEKHTEFNDNLGLSLVIVSTEKGLSIFSNLKESLISIETNVKDCLQPQLVAPLELPNDRSDFENLYIKKGFVPAAKKYGNLGVRHKFKVLRGYLSKYKRWVLIRLNKLVK